LFLKKTEKKELRVCVCFCARKKDRNNNSKANNNVENKQTTRICQKKRKDIAKQEEKK
jgi:hypothetical protein